ncbi:ATP-dependent RNA helicase DDX1 [Tupaia chinensis]|uniref:ATP-dependent RNA helicase DDX1 n=1 Tax=Tupaia chinensis TaxID=246437 RepID=L9KJE2_TUPCH|nr:ATP-dependent RNA helicase DDX1 [Tupaia chinensis]
MAGPSQTIAVSSGTTPLLCSTQWNKTGCRWVKVVSSEITRGDLDKTTHSQLKNLARDGTKPFNVLPSPMTSYEIYLLQNVTLPDEKQTYVHRTGRVRRTERMGLAISLVATEKEKVWYHVCSNRGKSCYNTRFEEDGGWTTWYDEMQLLPEMEEHLNYTISRVEPDTKVPVDEFDGKLPSGQKRVIGGGNHKGHVDILAPTVPKLAAREKEAQTSFLRLGYCPNQLFRTF